LFKNRDIFGAALVNKKTLVQEIKLKFLFIFSRSCEFFQWIFKIMNRFVACWLKTGLLIILKETFFEK